MQIVWAASRHYLLHLALAIAFYIALRVIGGEASLTLFIFATFLIDIDHLFRLIDQNDPTTKAIFEVINSDKEPTEKIGEVIKILDEKGFNKLVFHNFPALAFVIVVVFLHFKSIFLLSFFGAFLAHQLVDIVLDFVRWGNFNHWLWKEEQTFSQAPKDPLVPSVESVPQN